MLKLISRNEQYLSGYKEYCQEFYNSNIKTFKPMNPNKVTVEWFRNSLDWYKKREEGKIESQPTSVCLWAVEDSKFIGEFQVRTELTEQVMSTIGSIGYSVRTTEQGKGYGKLILREGLEYVRKLGMKKVILLIDESNSVSRNICEKSGGEYYDKILIDKDTDNEHVVWRYWIHL